MKRLSYNIIHLLTVAALAGAAGLSCTQAELLEPENLKSATAFEYVGEPTDVILDVTVSGLSVSAMTKGNGPVDDTEAEREVDNLWVFQYNADGSELVSDPQYITIDNQEILRNIPIILSDNNNEPCIIYVVTNTGDSGWVTKDANESYTDFSTLDELKAHALPTREPIWETDETLSIPMGGSNGEEEELYVVKGEVIAVPVRRMYAKIIINVNIGLEEEAYIYNVGIGNIPQYCRVESLSDDVEDETEAAEYPDDVVWVSRTFQTKDNEDRTPYVVYIPENLQGVQDPISESKSKDDPGGSAFYINVALSVYDSQGGVSQYPYLVYPGADVETDYNIRRNVVYYITFDINVLSEARVPSANCFVVIPGETLSFYPYYREESGGGHYFEDYLDPYGDTGEKISYVSIIWQTKDCIGDNESEELVWISPDEETHNGFEKIYVKTNKEGNALIGAYNTADEIIWSWHIWVTGNDPANEANAVTYYTYRWDGSGIKYDEDRIPGYQIMSCNLGALADEPTINLDGSFDQESVKRTYGMLYQWGRKDPFPPFYPSNSEGEAEGVYAYNDDNTEQLYGNDNTTPVYKTSEVDDSEGYYLFHSKIGGELGEGEGIKYSINNPTVFMCGTDEANVSIDLERGQDDSYAKPYDHLTYVTNTENYHNSGAWASDDHDYGMWGGLSNTTGDSYDTGIDNDAGTRIHLYDNYGSEKSIFDPCPYGWRVPPCDLWLGFTINEPNPSSAEEINSDAKSTNQGMYMYLDKTFGSGNESFFPLQGFRLADGDAYKANSCGNYANAQTDDDDRINITHLHNAALTFKLFETQFHYTVKSTGNPMRCVRDKK